MNKIEATELLDNVAKKDPSKIPAATNSILLDVLEQLEAMNNRLSVFEKNWNAAKPHLQNAVKISHALAPAVMDLRQRLEQMPAQVQTEVTMQAPQQTDVAPQVEGGGGGEERAYVHADGSPMSPEEVALEKMMDDATAGMPPHPGAGGK